MTYKIGDRVVVQKFNPAIDGLEGEVIGYGSEYPYRVRLDKDHDPFFEHRGRLFTESELRSAPIVEPVPALTFFPGDRVVYTPPETFYGRPGTQAADTGLIGKYGIVQQQNGPSGVTVLWRGETGSRHHAVEYIQPAPPEPTHEHPEGLYKSHGTYIVVRHEAKPEQYSFLYVSNALDGKREPVNRNMPGASIAALGYTLVTEFPA